MHRVAVVELDEIVGDVAVLFELERDLRDALPGRHTGDGIAARVERRGNLDARAIGSSRCPPRRRRRPRSLPLLVFAGLARLLGCARGERFGDRIVELLAAP